MFDFARLAPRRQPRVNTKQPRGPKETRGKSPEAASRLELAGRAGHDQPELGVERAQTSHTFVLVAAVEREPESKVARERGKQYGPDGAD